MKNHFLKFFRRNLKIRNLFCRIKFGELFFWHALHLEFDFFKNRFDCYCYWFFIVRAFFLNEFNITFRQWLENSHKFITVNCRCSFYINIYRNLCLEIYFYVCCLNGKSIILCNQQNIWKHRTGILCRNNFLGDRYFFYHRIFFKSKFHKKLL